MPAIGQKTSISTDAASALTSSATPVATQVYLRANTGNAGKLYLACTSAVTTGTGYEVNPGQEVVVHKAEIPSGDAANIFLIAAAGNANIASYRVI